ncbi:MAG TPA: helix-turn-helix transcriptional regulator [Solirubrobacteraceae bacterium]|jgi:DNA-binding PadR family transcriptional regulator|nr:helix-turn-helix transcriptional regulator [Solirubrobacteraceae bacterium]
MSINPADRGLLILTSLAEGDKHGYALMQDIEEFAGVRLGPGSLYGALARLEDESLIVALPPEARRRPYRISPTGTEVLKEELSAQATISRIGLDRLARSSR